MRKAVKVLYMPAIPHSEKVERVLRPVFRIGLADEGGLLVSPSLLPALKTYLIRELVRRS